MSRWRNRQTPAVESRSFAGSRPALDTGRWWNLVDTPRSERGAPCIGSSSLPRPTSFTPVAESVDAARSKRASTCRFDSCREYHAPERTVTVAASKTAIRGSIPRGCAMWEMPKWSRRLSAEQFLPGSSPGSHSIGGREATATLSGPENQRSGKCPDGGSTPPPSATTLKFLIFPVSSLNI